jgi:hypothetical protein
MLLVVILPYRASIRPVDRLRKAPAPLQRQQDRQSRLKPQTTGIDRFAA